MKNNHKPQDFLPVVIFVVFIIFFLSSTFAVLFMLPKNNAKDDPVSEVENVEAAQNTIIEVPFDYVVTSITPSLITLTGDNGDFVLPYNSSIITVNSLATNEQYTLETLMVGQTVDIKFIPGVSAQIFVK